MGGWPPARASDGGARVRAPLRHAGASRHPGSEGPGPRLTERRGKQTAARHQALVAPGTPGRWKSFEVMLSVESQLGDRFLDVFHRQMVLGLDRRTGAEGIPALDDFLHRGDVDHPVVEIL